ncbi:MAG: transporter substrate-binding domain-containing protein, partial [Firmicutes bacterium]|nr:transporter substrate-binding domain-containing protein [Bacillota bacterium]
MKRFLALFLVGLLVLTTLVGCGGNASDGSADGGDNSLQKVLDKGELTCAVSPDYAPYEYLDLMTNEVKGSDIVLAQYIADQLGVNLKIEQMSFETCLAAAQTGSVDICISSLSWKPERAEVMALSDYYNKSSAFFDQTILVRAEDEAQYNAAADFTGKKIAAQNGTTQMEMTRQQIPDVEAIPISLMNVGVLLLMEGKVDGVACQVDVAQSFVDNYDELAIPEFLFDFEELGNVVATKMGNDALLEKINEILGQVEADGLYAQWLAEATSDAQSQGL